MTLPRAFTPLRVPVYRWLIGSVVLSLLSGGMWIVALVWQVVALGGGPGDLSVAATGTAIGMFVTTLLGGALADRVPQRRILLTVEVINAVTLGGVAVLAISGDLRIWHLGAAGLLVGLGQGLYYPAYSALLPSLVPESELLAANGMEGMIRPALSNAGGPALASAVIAVWSPAIAIVLAAVAAAGAAACVLAVPETPVRREIDDQGRHPVVALVRDVGAGFSYMVRTTWLLGTLVFASLMIFVMMGPLEVLAPFAIKDNAGGGPADHSMVLAAFGIGGVVGSFVTASRRLPRRYLTVMNLLWGAGCIPLVVIGVAEQVWPMVLAAFVVGALFHSGVVIWGTLLQRRVPPAMLGRVSSLDFFVSLAFMPVSMAVAGPVSEAIELQTTFLVAGLVPVVLAIAAIVLGRMPADEIAHPLDQPSDAAGSPDDTRSAPPVPAYAG